MQDGGPHGRTRVRAPDHDLIEVVRIIGRHPGIIVPALVGRKQRGQKEGRHRGERPAEWLNGCQAVHPAAAAQEDGRASASAVSRATSNCTGALASAS
jgi:hypothetical protein